MNKCERIYKVFGKLEDHKCKECTNLVKGKYHDKSYFKCSVYGETRSCASDWRLNYTACGMFNKEYDGKTVMEIYAHVGKNKRDVQVDGQLTLDFGE